MSVSKVMKADMRQPCFLKDFSEGMADYTGVKGVTIRKMTECEVTVGRKLSQQDSFGLLLGFMLTQ
ncbi:hypothetical protein ES708_07212 [subsurface metagenome]